MARSAWLSGSAALPGECHGDRTRALGHEDRSRVGAGRQRDRTRQLPALPAPGRAQRRRRLPGALLHLPARDRDPADVGRVRDRTHGRSPRSRPHRRHVRAALAAPGCEVRRRARALHPVRGGDVLRVRRVVVPRVFVLLADRQLLRPRLDGRGRPLPGRLPGRREEPALLEPAARVWLLRAHLRPQRRDPARRRRARHRAARVVGDAAAVRVRGDPDGARADARSAAGRRPPTRT